MQYELRIEGEAGTIKLASLAKNDSVIKKVEFVISQEKLDTNDRSENLFNTLVIEGELKDRTQQETKELLEWSLKNDKVNVYKTVSLIVKKDTDVIRDYYLKDMFCVSYEEFFCENEESGKDTYGTFVLKMRQRKGSIETIKVDC